MSDYLFTTLIKVDHIIFKHNVYTAILEENKEDAAVFGDHTSCRLGKWYLGKGKEKFGTTPSFKALHQPHLKVHESALRALSYVRERDYIINYKEDLITNMADAEVQSFKLFELFKGMVTEANPDIKF